MPPDELDGQELFELLSDPHWTTPTFLWAQNATLEDIRKVERELARRQDLVHRMTSPFERAWKGR